MQPGETITPGGVPPTPPPEAQPVPPSVPEPAPTLPPAEVNPPEAPQAEQTEAQSFYNPEPTQAQPSATLEPINWTASEYIDHPKGAKWFVLFGFGLALIIIVVYLTTKDVVAPVLIGFAGMIFGSFAGRQPQVLNYGLDSSGLTISKKHYAYTEFKSFSVMDEGPFRSILLAPLKRFMPPLSIYYDPKDEDKIIDTLADFLPVEQQEHDLTDRLMRRLHF